jgi:hypothetical protein
MTFPFVVPDKSAFESSEMGLPVPDVECGSAHIGGAKSIRLDD